MKQTGNSGLHKMKPTGNFELKQMKMNEEDGLMSMS